jgi:CrcB protein
MRVVQSFLERTLAVGLGGALGAIARYWVSGLVARLSGQHAFPWGTLTVNVAGAFVLGVLMGATVSGRIVVHPTFRTFVAVGLLGAFTTFSTFAYETLEAMRAGDVRFAVLNVGVSLAVGLTVAWAGLQIGERM